MENASTLSSALLEDTKADGQAESLSKAAGPASSPLTAPSSSVTKPRVFKIIVLGESGVGKTCLSFRFCAGKFPLSTEATIGLDFREKVNLL
jgi:Ras-related protein Rab-33B